MRFFFLAAPLMLSLVAACNTDTQTTPEQGATGATGPAGAAGPTGATGADGPVGMDGAAGLEGQVGPVGPVGPTGAAGATGADGAVGAIGATGAQGLSGAVGAQGPVGPTGPTGATGPVGATGATGTAGAPGTAGATGATGATGTAGAPGAAGAPGTAGATGATGPAGPTQFKSSSFVFATVTATGSTQFTSLTFTPPQSGFALARARGYCNIYGSASASQYQAVVLSIDTTVNAYGGNQANWGVAQSVGMTTSMSVGQGWSSERTFPVTGGTAMTLYLAGASLWGTANHDCSGTLTVELFSSALP